VVALWLFAGCASTTDARDAGDGETTAPEATSPSPAWSGNVGTISLTPFGLTAQFAEGVPPVDSSQLDETVVDAGAGSCSGTHEVGPQNTAGVVGTIVSAGTLTLTADGVTAVATEQSVAGAVSYESGMRFAPGDIVTIRASGAVVPAFSLTVSIPGPTTFVLPATDAASLTIVRSQDLPLAWTGGDPSNGLVLVTINEGAEDATNTTGTFINCVLPAGAGSGVVPASLLGDYLVPSGADGGPLAYISVASFAKSTASVGDWTITVTAPSVVSAGGWQGGATVR
jgi:hypothetical protein